MERMFWSLQKPVNLFLDFVLQISIISLKYISLPLRKGCWGTEFVEKTPSLERIHLEAFSIWSLYFIGTQMGTPVQSGSGSPCTKQNMEWWSLEHQKKRERENQEIWLVISNSHVSNKSCNILAVFIYHYWN